MEPVVQNTQTALPSSLPDLTPSHQQQDNPFPEPMAIRRPKTSSNSWKLLQEFDVNISNGNIDSQSIQGICNFLKSHGKQLDDGPGKSQLDSYFNEYRNLIRSNQVDLLSKCYLLELIELRGSKWNPNQEITDFYQNHRRSLERKKSHQTSSSVSSSRNSSKDSSLDDDSEEGSNGHHHPKQQLQRQPSFKNKSILKSNSSVALNQQQSSNNNMSSTGKNNLIKEELIIRNSDSGKVMGIKGRRVKMIEEMSDTIISFQRVVAGVRDRLLQITGTRSESIEKAKKLILDTILRNCSPTPDRQHPPPTRLITSGNSKGSSSGLQRSSSLGHVLKKRAVSTEYYDDDYLFMESVFTGNPDQVLKVTANSSALLRESVQALKSHFELKKNLKRYLPEFEFEFGDSDREDDSDDSEADSDDNEVEDILSKQERDEKQRQSITKKTTENANASSSRSTASDDVLRSHVSKLVPIESMVAPCDVTSSSEDEFVIEGKRTQTEGCKTEGCNGKQGEPKRISYTREFLMSCQNSVRNPLLELLENKELSCIVKLDHCNSGATNPVKTDNVFELIKDGDSIDTSSNSTELTSGRSSDKSESR